MFFSFHAASFWQATAFLNRKMSKFFKDISEAPPVILKFKIWNVLSWTSCIPVPVPVLDFYPPIFIRLNGQGWHI